MRVDWPAVLGDIAYRLGDPIYPGTEIREPVSSYQLAEYLAVARGTLRGWLDGSEPKHADGEQLLDRWCTLTGKAREFAPLVRRSLSAGQAR